MSEKKANWLPTRSFVRTAAITLGCCFWWMFCFELLIARGHGQSVSDALRTALRFQDGHFWWGVIMSAWLCVTLFFIPGNTRHASFQEWKESRLGGRWAGTMYLSLIGIGACVALMFWYFTSRYNLHEVMTATGFEWQRDYIGDVNNGGVGQLLWWLAGITLPVIGAIFWFWRRNPEHEAYIAQSTGDEAGLNDEREQLVKGKAATSTLYALAVPAILGGMLYETLFLGTYPVFTLCSGGIGLIIWSVSYKYWNRKL
jgi:hypothetical protein